MKNRVLAVVKELKLHAPFTLFGAVIGMLCMFLFRYLGPEINHRLFQAFHPLHVVLSAMVTASLFKMRSGKTAFWLVLVVGYFGSIGVATLSDCIIPYYGETILGVAIPSHASQHVAHDPGQASEVHVEEADAHAGHDHEGEACTDGHEGKPHLHLGFIEDWYIVNPSALLGIFLACLIPHERLHSRFPHAAHVLVSTWASLFHVLANLHADLTGVMVVGIFLALFVAVWLPCCISDIVFPMLFVGEGAAPCCCVCKPKESSEEA